GLRAADEGGRGRLMTIGKIIVLAVIIAMGCAALVFSWPHRAVAQGLGCISINQDRAIVEANGYEWLGVETLPVLPGVAEPAQVVLYRFMGLILASPINPAGCVHPRSFPV